MRVLVTGGHGFVGSHLVRLLREQGAEVRCLYRHPGAPASLEGLGAEIVRGDLRDPAALGAALEGVDVVHHLAALTRSRSRAQMMETNLQATVALVGAARAAGNVQRFVFCSSLAAVGPSPDGTPLDEGAPCRPLTWYGESKMRAEAAVREGAGPLPFTIVRPPAVYGPRDRDFLAVFQAASRGFLPVLGSGRRTYSFIYAEDLARGLLAAGEAAGTAGGTYFATHPDVLELETFLRGVAEAVGRRGRLVRVSDGVLGLAARIGELASQLSDRPPLINRQRLRELSGRAYVCRGEALARDAGWSARVDLSEGARRTTAWYREEGRLPERPPR